MGKTKRWIAIFAMLALGLGVFLSGCSDDDEDVVPTPAPVAEFSADNTIGPAPLTVNFTDNSTGSVTTWSWDFGDNTASTQQNPQHTYTAAGSYTVSLTVTGPGGSDTETKVGFITVGQAPTTGLEFTTGNMVEVAYLGTDTADIFSKIGFVFSEIIGNLPPIPNGVPAASPLAAVPVGPSGLCQVAEVDNVVWNDNDNNSLPTVGDTIEVFWEDCAIDNTTNLYGDPSGSGNPAVTFTFTDNVSETPPIVVTGTLDLNILIVESGFSSTLKGTMSATGSADNQAVTINLGDVFGTAADTEITTVDLDGGTGEIKFGCFDVQIIFDNVANPFDFSMSVRGVERIQTPLGANILQLGDYEEGLAPGSMSFVNGIPESGSLKLLSFDNRANSTVITGLASCYDNVTGTTAELVTADGEGLGHVDLFTDIDPADPWGGEAVETQDIDWLDGII